MYRTSAAFRAPRYLHGSSIGIFARRDVWEENNSFQGKKKLKQKNQKKPKTKQSLNPRRTHTSALICIQHLAPLVMAMQVKRAS